MTNIASVLKSEISRLSRKEVHAQLDPLRKSVAHHRSSIAAVKRQTAQLQRQLRQTSKNKPAADEPAGDGVRHRFQARGLATHRKALGLSAADYGRLVGVTGQTIYKWEDGKAKPRVSQLEALAAVRGMGKRQAAKRLEELDSAGATQHKAAGARKPSAKKSAAGRTSANSRGARVAGQRRATGAAATRARRRSAGS